MDEKDAVTNFLNEVTEPKDIFKEETVQEVEPEDEVEEKPLPFHRDPKVQRYVEKQVEKALRDKAPATASTETATPSDVKDVIEAFTEIIGNDTPEKVKALQKLEKTLAGSDERATQKAIERFKEEMSESQRAQEEADTKAQEELDSHFEDIEETYNVDLSSNSASARQLRSQFIDYVRKVAPKDENGEVAMFPDMLGAFEDFQERLKRNPTRAKELASRGLARSTDTQEGIPKFVVGKGDPWKQVDQHLDKLKANN